jgi:hypothetical protein
LHNRENKIPGKNDFSPCQLLEPLLEQEKLEEEYNTSMKVIKRIIQYCSGFTQSEEVGESRA